MTPLADLDGNKTRRQSGFDAVTWLTLYVIVLYSIPSRLVVGPLGSAGAVSMLVGLASFGLWAINRVGTTVSTTLEPQPIRRALCVFIAAVCVSYALAMSRPLNPDEVSPSDVALIALISWTGTLLMANDGIPSRRRLDDFLWRLAVAGGLMAALGLFQFGTKQSWVDKITVPGLTATNSGAAFFRDGLLRPNGTAIHPIEYGALLSMLLPVSLHAAFHFKSKPFLVRWAPTALIAAVIVLSSSRTAYLTSAVSLVICFIGWVPRQRRIFLMLAALGVGSVSVAAPRVLREIMNLFAGVSQDPSIASRTDSYGLAWAFFAQHPAFGRGLGTFLPKYRIFDNQYLGLLVSAGLVGTTALIVLALSAINSLIRLYRASRLTIDKDLAISLVGALVAGFMSLAFFDAFAFPMTMGTVFLVLGVAGSATKLLRDAPQLEATEFGGSRQDLKTSIL